MQNTNAVCLWTPDGMVLQCGVFYKSSACSIFLWTGMMCSPFKGMGCQIPLQGIAQDSLGLASTTVFRYYPGLAKTS